MECSATGVTSHKSVRRSHFRTSVCLVIPAQVLIDGFGRNVGFLEHLVDGIAHSESLLQPPCEANCLNWTVGHIAAYREVVMHLVELPGVAEAGELDRYQRESEPIREDGPGVVQLARLVTLLELGGPPLSERLDTMGPEAWRADTVAGDRTTTVAERLTFLYFHDTLHLGHVEILAAMISG